ncbi:fatty-acid amide hydrolase 1 [Electrophorus electricus]|uniref:fatty-acid amide hydrolase 1 n=1 Tax=Electrophorus electricus TaxID=8005 RepID=UPI0015CF9E67|nr:fatty-acid amide hydrolase 1 [Electrophorus electricus]
MDQQLLQVVIALACVASVLVLLLKWTRYQRAQKKILRARERRTASLEQAEQAVHEFKKANPGVDSTNIVSLPLAELTKRIRSGSLQPEAVLHAYIEKALEVNQKLNCGTDVLMESLKQLEDIESHRNGILYGVPVSLKENIGYKGYDSSCGVLCKLNEPALNDSVVVRVLKRQGAVPFIKTNIPQGLLNYECSNPIYGMTVNPHNLQKTCGGSSGGEGALIGGGGSILGLGTDIAGSIRIPASFCGICGFKPTFNRISLHGVNSCVKGIKSVPSSIGPMARDVESLALCMRALLSTDMFSLDPTIPPLPFNQQVYDSTEHLRIGYYDNDGYHQPSPSMSRALQETKKLLEQAGHTLVPFQPPRLFMAIHEYATKGILADGGTTLLRYLEEGPIDPCLQPQAITYSIPRFVKKILSIFLRPICPRMASAMNAICGVNSVTDMWEQHKNIEDYISEVIAEWRRLEMDVLLCPVLGPAYNFYYSGMLTSSLSYTVMYNLLNFPAGVVPVTTVTADDEAQMNRYRGNFADIWDKLFLKAVQDSVGLPVAVQCVSLPWQDELCLRFMREVEKLSVRKKHTNTY